jgi:polysaccharide export outer membrane protein
MREFAPMSLRHLLFAAAAMSLMLGGCASGFGPMIQAEIDGPAVDGYPVPVTPASARPGDWGPAIVIPAVMSEAVAGQDSPYRLDSGDRIRVFVYGQPSLSRLYIVDPDGKISVPLIGTISARGKTTTQLQGIIRSRLGSEYVKDPQVSVDIQQNRPFFIFGEVRNAGQYPYVSGMTVETAVAIGGGYTERASDRSFRITRKVDGLVQEIEAPGIAPIRPGDTVYVFERYF